MRSTSRALLMGLCLSAVAVAVPTAVLAQFDGPDKYGGDLLARPRLTGDWGGVRDEMAKRGVFLDLDLLQILQGVMSGGRDTDVSYWGEASYTLTVDSGKLGLWPGGFLKVHALSSYGNSANEAAGAIVPLTAASLLPATDDPGTALMNLTFTQFLAPWVGIYVGKVETLGGDANEFADDYHTKFLYSGFDFNMVNAFVPLSAVGGGIMLLPWSGAVVTAGVLDPSGEPNDTFGDPFSDGVMVTAEGRFTIKPFGRVGHQTLGFAWSNKEHFSVEQDPANIARLLATERFPRLADPGRVLGRFLERFFPGLLVPTTPASTESSTWSVYYNFDQYLWHPGGDTTRGIGVFFRFGLSDGEANPVKYGYNAGIGGKGVIPGRPHDTFGVGWARTQFSDSFVPFLRDQLNLGLEREDAYEAFYNIAIAPWLGVTVNLQVLDQGLGKRLDSAGGLKSVDPAVIGGLRMYVRF